MTPQDRARYLRQIIFSPLGEAGQEKLLAARVLIVGCGATGSVIANTLARAGVGHIKIADRDFIELSNLQRQILFDEDDIAQGLPKAIAAANKLRQINSSIAIEPYVTDVNPENIEDLVEDVDLVLDGTDNFETRYLINDACVKHNKRWIYGGAVASYGSSMTIIPRVSACFRCVFFKSPPPGTLPTCDTAGVIAPIVSVIGSLVSVEAIKLLTGSGTRNEGLTDEYAQRGEYRVVYSSVMIHIDLWENSFETFQVTRRADCPTCAENNFEFLDDARGGVATAFLCGRDAVQVRPGRGQKLYLPMLADRLSRIGDVSFNEYLLQFKIDGYEMTIFPDARAIVKGTEDETVAKTLYAKYVGI